MSQLYRHFDAEGKLLYVGKSLNAVKRQSRHKQTADWFLNVARIEIEQIDGHPDAVECETIRREKPIYNKKRPVGFNPDCQKCEARRKANKLSVNLYRQKRKRAAAKEAK